MFKKVFLALSLVAFITCNTSNQINQKQDPNKPVARLDITGIWTSGQSENATFRIDKDSIFYVDALQSFKYLIVGDSYN